MNVVENMRIAIASHDLAASDSPVLLMVSGGSDSTALAYAAADLRDEGVLGPLALLHVNHRLRGAASDRDAAFVNTLARLLSIPAFSCEIEVARIAAETGGNVEAVAREERFNAARDALKSLCSHFGAPLEKGVIFTAHTADDRVENFYMRSIVGTGPGGLRSMRWRTGNVAHPLLSCGRDDLRAFITERAEGEKIVLEDEGLLWREDATNACTDQFRAYVRHKIVPLAKERNPRLLETLGRTMDLIADEDDLVEQLADDARAAYARQIYEDDATDGFVLDPQLVEAPLPVRRRVVFSVLRDMLGYGARVEEASVAAVLAGWRDDSSVNSGYVSNIQGDIAVSANKQGVRIEPMAAFRARRKRR